jgi:hypothetical protein
VLDAKEVIDGIKQVLKGASLSITHLDYIITKSDRREAAKPKQNYTVNIGKMIK